MLTPAYPMGEHPRGTFVRAQALAVREAGANVAICHLDGTSPLYGRPWAVDRRLDGDLPVYHVRFRLPMPWRPPLWPLLVAGTAAGLRAVAADHGAPDVLHAHFDAAALPAAILGRVHGVPVVHSEHSSEFRRPMSRSRALRARSTVRLASLTCPVSSDLADCIRRVAPGRDFEVVPNSIDTDLFRADPSRNGRGDPARLLCVALLDPKKGVPDLIEAFARLPDGRATLDVVGDGDERTRCEQLVTELGLRDRVRLRGLQPPAEVARLMREADLFVLPSHTENNPCVLLESMASGLPIVATAVGGVPEVVDDKVGTLVEPRAPDRLAAAIDGAIDTLDRFDRDAMRRRAEARYSNRAIGRRWLSIYERLLSARKRLDRR